MGHLKSVLAICQAICQSDMEDRIQQSMDPSQIYLFLASVESSLIQFDWSDYVMMLLHLQHDP